MASSPLTVSVSQSELKELESKFVSILVVSSLLRKAECPWCCMLSVDVDVDGDGLWQ